VSKQTDTKEEKWALARKEAEYYLEPNESKYQIMFTIKGNWMFANAGIDESNSAGFYSLWPKDPQKSLNSLWGKLREHYRIRQLGLIMTDSHAIPLNWGVVGHGIAYCGFRPLKNYVGTPDLHGRLLEMEQLSLVQSLAVAGVMEMGEGSEQQPLAVITDIKQSIEFQDNPPTLEELQSLHISLEDDAFAPLLTRVPWKKGK
jgi:coenzyme F420-0:L-glutamate ligase/coenzyme F420-1:gamma-L-glutamate ligase